MYLLITFLFIFGAALPRVPFRFCPWLKIVYIHQRHVNIVICQYHDECKYLWMIVSSEPSIQKKGPENAVHHSSATCRPERRYVNGSLIKSLLRILNSLCVCTWKRVEGEKVPLSGGDEGIALRNCTVVILWYKDCIRQWYFDL